MHSLSSTVGIIAIAAAVAAVVALASALALWRSIRRLRGAQQAVLGDGRQDLVAHAAHLQASFESLASYVEDATTHLDARVRQAEARLEGAICHRALVRYDAYGEMSGRQSTSIALLDARHSGVVLSAIHHRDHAILYAKQVHFGEGEVELSPEEQEAIARALEVAGENPDGDPVAAGAPRGAAHGGAEPAAAHDQRGVVTGGGAGAGSRKLEND